MNVVVDANVVVKWYLAESDLTLARAVLEIDGILVAPAHVLGEVGHVLLTRFREGKIEQGQLALARRAIPGTLLLVSLDKLFDEAFEIAAETRMAYYDALYIAAAIRWQTYVVTADKAMIDLASMSRWSDRVVLLKEWQSAGQNS